jgi:hypothetical protein
MADIGEFAREAADRFRVMQDTVRIDPTLYRSQGLPLTRPTAEKFIKAAYYASLIPDEGRWPSTCLMCYRSECALQFHTLFDEPREPTADEIAKLAHAVDNRSHIACICEEDKITLGGFHVNMLSSQREFGYGSGRVANPLKVSIRRPGNIDVSTGGLALVFRGGEITEEQSLRSSDTMKRLVARVETQLRQARDGAIKSLDTIFDDLMGAIVRFGHGGMVIFAGAPKASHFSSLRRTNCIYFNQLLEDYWDRSAELVTAAGGVAALLNPRDRRACSMQMLQVASATDRLENCLQAIANLSGLDGAIVLTYGCNVGAFNAIINRQASAEVEPQLIDEYSRPLDYQQTFARRGSRHQSALLYSRCVPDSFVFVISQDGSISAFHNPNDGTVVCEFGMRPIE